MQQQTDARYYVLENGSVNIIIRKKTWLLHLQQEKLRSFLLKQTKKSKFMHKFHNERFRCLPMSSVYKLLGLVTLGKIVSFRGTHFGTIWNLQRMWRLKRWIEIHVSSNAQVGTSWRHIYVTLSKLDLLLAILHLHLISYLVSARISNFSK